jgi:glycosyltransferase involved in cell wall biosynthesis
MESISVVLPIYNQSNYIEQVIQNVEDILPEITDDYEIIIVDDASTDNTRQIIDQLSNDYVRMICNDRRAGIPQRLKEGLLAAKKDVILYSDADLCFDLHDIKKAIRAMRFAGADVISAYRLDRTREGFLRGFIFSGYNFIIRTLFGLPVRDINFSFKLLKREVLDKINLRSNSVFLDTELLVKCHRKGFNIHQIGVDYFYREGILTPITFKLFFNTLIEIFRLKRDLRKMRE